MKKMEQIAIGLFIGVLIGLVIKHVSTKEPENIDDD